MGFQQNLHSIPYKHLRSKLLFALEFIVSSVLGITIIFPVLGILLFLNELLRLCFRLYLWVVDSGTKLSDDGMGNNYIMLPANDRKVILYLGEVEGTLDVESIQNNYQKHVIENKTYSLLTYTWQKHWLYTCMKKCDSFDIRNHIRYYPGTEERVVSEKELLQTILPDLSDEMTDPTKPQWEEVIIPYYQNPKASQSQKEEDDTTESEASKETISLRIIRIHHAYMDGANTLIMLANTFSEGATFPYVIDPCKPLKISKLSMFLYKLTCVALFSTNMLRNILMPPFLRKSRFTVDYAANGKKLFSWTKKIPMEYFQRIKEKSGVGMPAIVSTVLASAIRNLELRYPLMKRNGNGVMEEVKVPDVHPLWIVAGMFPYPNNKPGNKHVVIETLVNTTDISGCERLSIMNDDLGRLAKNPTVTVFYWITQILGRVPTFISEVFLNLTSCPAIVSNIPLCTRNVKLWGKECTSLMGWVPLLGKSGLGVVTVRYADHFRYCVQVDSSTVNQEELDYFILQIEQQVEELIIETSQLRRKISTETSLFDHKGDKNPAVLSSTDDVTKDDDQNDKEEQEASGNALSTSNNNNVNKVNGRFSLGGAITSTNYSYLFKLKDSIEQIKDGIRKIKEH